VLSLGGRDAPRYRGLAGEQTDRQKRTFGLQSAGSLVGR
jgi:hypothetical protein